MISHSRESTLAKILSPRTRYKVAGRIRLISGICLRDYKMPLTRYVFFKENEILRVLSMFFLPQSCNDLIFELMAVQIGFVNSFQHSMIEQYNLIAQI